MRWQGRRKSSNIDDRRSAAPKAALGGGIGIVVLAIIVVLLGGNPQALLTGGGPLSPGTASPISPADEQRAEFVAVVLADTEDVWNHLLPQATGSTYREPTLVLFRDRVQSACGLAGDASGPFYCPGDEQIYIDLDFFDQLSAQLGAPGDFAQAYVIAHEVGHHVQRLMGTLDRVHAQRSRLSEAEYNDLSVRLELQADFFAGVWAHHAQRSRSILEPGDLEEALTAAAAIGDDRLQRQAQGYVVPDSFTHGTSAQRVRWFRLGFETGDLARGDTFSVPDP